MQYVLTEEEMKRYVKREELDYMIETLSEKNISFGSLQKAIDEIISKDMSDALWKRYAEIRHIRLTKATASATSHE